MKHYRFKRQHDDDIIDELTSLSGVSNYRLIILIWWLMIIGSVIVSGFSMFVNQVDLESIRTGDQLALAASGMRIIAALIMVVIIWQVTKHQKARLFPGTGHPAPR